MLEAMILLGPEHALLDPTYTLKTLADPGDWLACRRGVWHHVR